MDEIKSKVKSVYTKFRSQIMRYIDQKNFNEAYKLALQMEGYLLQISINYNNLAGIDKITEFNVFVNKLKDSCTYKNQKNCNRKLDEMDGFFFKELK